MWMQHMDDNKIRKEKAWSEFYKNAARCLGQILGATLYKTVAVRSLTSYLINHLSKTNKMCGTLLEKQGRIHK